MNFKTSLLIFVITTILISCGTGKSLLSKNALKKMNYEEVIGFYNHENSDSKTPDTYPMYPYGLKGLMRDVNNNVYYPEKAIAENTEGMVLVRYLIEKDGSINNISIEKSVSKEIDEEAIRVIKNLKKWHPAFVNKEPVRAEFIQPFNFTLEE